jgi:hypothetical protein
MKNEPCFKAVASTSENTNNGGSNVHFADSETMKYRSLVKSNAPDQDDDDDDNDDDELMQQRVYDMPSSDSDSDSDEVDEPKPVLLAKPVLKIKAVADHINVDDI